MLQCSKKRIKLLLYRYFEYSTISQFKECNEIGLQQFKSQTELRTELLNVLEKRKSQLNPYQAPPPDYSTRKIGVNDAKWTGNDTRHSFIDHGSDETIYDDECDILHMGGGGGAVKLDKYAQDYVLDNNDIELGSSRTRLSGSDHLYNDPHYSKVTKNRRKLPKNSIRARDERCMDTELHDHIPTQAHEILDFTAYDVKDVATAAASDPGINRHTLDQSNNLSKFELRHLKKMACMQKHSYQSMELNGKNVSFNENLKYFIQACIDTTSARSIPDPLSYETNVLKEYRKKIEAMCKKQKFSLALHTLNNLSNESHALDFSLFWPLLTSALECDFQQCKYLMPRIINTLQNAGLPITMAIHKMPQADQYIKNKLEKMIADYFNSDVKCLRNTNGSQTSDSNDTKIPEDDGLEYIHFDYVKSNAPNFRNSRKYGVQVKNETDEGGKKIPNFESPRTSENLVLKAQGTLVHLGMKAHKRLRSALKRNDPSSLTTVSSIEPFNVLLEFWARHGYVLQMQSLYHMIKFLGILPDVQTYSNFFLCFGLHQFAPGQDVKRFLGKLVTTLTNQSLSLNDLVISGQFSGADVEHMIKAILIVDPSFQPAKPQPVYRYDVSLLRDLRLGSTGKHVSSPFEGLMDKATLKERFKQQFKIESSGSMPIKSIFDPVTSSTEDPKLWIKKNRALLKLKTQKDKWESEITSTFKANLQSMKTEWEEKALKRGYFSFNLYPFLRLMPERQYVDLMMQEVEFLATSTQFYSPSSIFLYKQLGLKINQKYIVRQKLANGAREKLTKIYGNYIDYFVDKDTFWKQNPRTSWNKACLKTLGWSLQLEFKNLMWPSTYHIGIGKFLYSIILQNLKVDINGTEDNAHEKKTSPAFFSIYRQYSVSQKEEFKPHPQVIKLYRNDNYNQNLSFDPHMLPMISPPVPWTGVKTGGYLLCDSSLVRLYEPFGYHNQLLNKTPVKQLYPVFDSLTYLGVCPWIINKPILDIIIQIFNSNGNDKLGIPSYQSKKDNDEHNKPLYTICKNAANTFHKMKNSTDIGTKTRHGSGVSVNSINPKTQSDMYSLWCDMLYKLSIANHFRDKVFWFPHNMDFRSRVYPIPPYFNHLNADSIRSLMLFARGQPLGPHGLRWLKLHLVNLLGTHKRCTLAERLEYVESKLATIMDCASHPLKEGHGWWMEADDPWQALACCMEIANASKRPDPGTYVSHFPIHQDGSCNGLQHYAALGRDLEGASQVNLIPSDKPRDVYTAVAENVELLRQQDAELGDEAALLLEDRIGRKVVKQTVMTVVYGVTRYGAKEQITRQLEALSRFDKGHLKQCSIYLVEKTFESIKKLFTATREIQDWFTDCARTICGNTNLTLEWTTPLGFPVAQPYSKRTSLHLPKGFHTDPTSVLQLRSGIFEKPMTVKQKNAFPPNFIHSLDSSHMMLTALHCQRHGINFVAVHDCFWTHACNVEVMNQVCRQQFVNLHQQPILEELSNFFVKNYSYTDEEMKEAKGKLLDEMRNFNHLLRRVPKKGHLNIEEVLKSTFFFS